MARKSGGKKASGSKKTVVRAKGPQPKRHRGWRYWALGAALVAVVVALYAILAGYVTLLPVVVIPLMTGALIGLVMCDVIPAASFGVAAGLLGAIAAQTVFKPETFVAVLNSMKTWMRPDILTPTFQSLLDLVTTNQMNTTFAGGVWPWYVVLAAAISGVAAAGAAWAGKTRANSRLIQWSVVALACICMVQSTYIGSAALRQQIATPPTDGQYGYDAMFNLRTYYLMRDGQGLYPAYFYSIAKDSRYIGQNLWQNGKQTTGSASLLREPLAFEMWQVVGFKGPNGILYFSMLCATAVMVVGYWAFREPLGASALLIPLALAPGLMLHGMWLNIFFPDWWGALAFMASAFVLATGRWRTAAVLGVLACLFREVFCIWLAVVALVAWVRVIRTRRHLQPALWFSGGLLVSVAAYLLHVYIGDQYIVHVQNTGESVFSALRNLSTGSLVEKAWPAIYYLMSPYWMTVLPPLVLLVAGAIGYAFVGSSIWGRAALSAYIVLTVAMYFTVGAHSSYWGQDVTLFAVAGTAVLVGRGLLELMPAEMRPALDELS